MTFKPRDKVRISNSYLADEAPEGAWGYIVKRYEDDDEWGEPDEYDWEVDFTEWFNSSKRTFPFWTEYNSDHTKIEYHWYVKENAIELVYKQSEYNPEQQRDEEDDI